MRAGSPAPVGDSEEPTPGRVGNLRRDRDFLAAERVHECRLADIRAAGDGHDPALHASRHPGARVGGADLPGPRSERRTTPEELVRVIVTTRPPFRKTTRSTPISCSHWRQPPHGDAVIAATAKSPGRYPSATARENAVRSAHTPSGYAAFSTFTPSITLPSRASTAQPTWKFEYGAYARARGRVRQRAEAQRRSSECLKRAAASRARRARPPLATSDGRVHTGLDASLRHEQRHDEGHGGDQEAVRRVVEHERHRHPAREGDRRVPGGSPPRSGVPRPVYALTAITMITVTASATSVSSAGASDRR